jgi:hypothetical protein
MTQEIPDAHLRRHEEQVKRFDDSGKRFSRSVNG